MYPKNHHNIIIRRGLLCSAAAERERERERQGRQAGPAPSLQSTNRKPCSYRHRLSSKAVRPLVKSSCISIYICIFSLEQQPHLDNRHGVVYRYNRDCEVIKNRVTKFVHIVCECARVCRVTRQICLQDITLLFFVSKELTGVVIHVGSVVYYIIMIFAYINISCFQNKNATADII